MPAILDRIRRRVPTAKESAEAEALELIERLHRQPSFWPVNAWNALQLLRQLMEEHSLNHHDLGITKFWLDQRTREVYEAYVRQVVTELTRSADVLIENLDDPAFRRPLDQQFDHALMRADQLLDLSALRGMDLNLGRNLRRTETAPIGLNGLVLRTMTTMGRLSERIFTVRIEKADKDRVKLAEQFGLVRRELETLMALIEAAGLTSDGVTEIACQDIRTQRTY